MASTLIYDTALAAGGAIGAEMLALAVATEILLKSTTPATSATWVAPLMLAAPLGGSVAALYYIGGKPVGGDMALPIVLAYGISYLLSPNKGKN